MTLRKKLLTLDIIVLLSIAVFAIFMNETDHQDLLIKFYVPIMLTVYYLGRYIPLQIVKKHIKNQS